MPTYAAVSEWWTIGADLGVAAGTALLAGFTGWLGWHTRAAARATAQEVRSNSRPVLIAAAGSAVKLEVGGPPNKNYGTLKLPIYNAGRGPALNAFAYALTTASDGDERTFIVNVGNIASDNGATVEVLSVKNIDASETWERDGFLAIRVVIVYADLAGARFHTVVRLSDPEGGARRDATAQWVDLVAEGTTIGEGANPAQQQWRVTFRGSNLDDEQVRRLRADAIQYTGGHSVGSGPTPEAASSGTWSSTVFVLADRSSDAINRVRTMLGGDDAPFGGWKAEPWGLEPLVFKTPTRRERAVEWVRHAWGRVRHSRRDR